MCESNAKSGTAATLASMSMETALEKVGQWPVDKHAAAVITAKGTTSVGDVDRVFELASVTKLLSAYGVLMAVEEGALEFDEPLGPEGSTVRHLLAHASGVAFDSRENPKPVGERRIYSSAGYEWLAEKVAQEADMSFAEYLRLGVFEPLGMTDTQLWGSAGHEARSSVADLTKFAAELLDPKLLAPSTARKAMTVQFPGLRGIVPGYGMQKPNDWGLGFEIRGEKSPHWTGTTMPAETVGHFGMAGTYLWVVPSRSVAMIALSDRDFGDWAKPLWAETNDAVWSELQQ